MISSSTAAPAAPRAAGRPSTPSSRTLRRLEHDETLLVQSGKPVGVFRTHAWAPRVLIANSLLVPAWATWEHFRDLEDRGLTMYGQMTAGSWIYIGTQGILQGTYETFAELARRHFGGTLAGRLVVTAGLGGMGGAQPLAATMNGGVALVVEVDPQRIERRLATSYLDERTDDLDEALDRVDALAAATASRVRSARRQRRRRSAGARPPRRHARRRHRSDLGARCAQRLRAERHVARAKPTRCGARIPTSIRARSIAAMADARARDARRSSATARSPSTTATTSARRRSTAASRTPSTFPGFVPEYIRPLFCEGKGPFRWAALSGDPATSTRPTTLALEMFSARRGAVPLDSARARARRVPGTAGAHLLARLRRARAVRPAINDLVRRGVVKAPIVIGRDHLDAGSVASPNRETEAMNDGSDAIADWPVLNALLEHGDGRHLGVGASWRRRRHRLLSPRRDGRRRRRIARSRRELERVLTCDPGIGVVRHADAGYPEAIDTARRFGIDMPAAGGSGQ